MKVLIKRPHEPAEVTEINPDLNGFQKAIGGGFLEAIPYLPAAIVANGIDAYGDDEAKLKGMKPHMLLENGDTACGPLVFYGGVDVEGNEIGLSEEQVTFLKMYLG